MKNLTKNLQVWKDMCNILQEKDPTEGLVKYVGEGLMAENFPELQEMVEFKTKAKSKHLWNHVLQVVKRVPADNLTLRWAALFHDVGKPGSFKEEEGEVTFHGHEVLGEEIWNRVAGRLGLARKFKEKVALLIRMHLRFAACAGAPGLTDKAIRKLLREAGDHLEDLYTLTLADITSSKDWRVMANQKRCKELMERIKALVEEDKKVIPKLPKGLGSRLYDTLGYKGPKLGEAMAFLKEKLEAGEIEATDDFGYYIRIMVDKIMKEKEGA